jgi:ADP-heptose:LPS heptosyltransferase
MGSLPRFLRAALGAFPKPNIYLVPDGEEVSRWRSIFPNGLTIGICWRSGKTGGHRSLQFAPLEAWASFLRELSATIVSVQYDATHDEIARLEHLSGKKILVPQGIDQKNQLDRTCGLIAALDAVISAPTAVSWLAASAGIPTFKVLYDTSWTSFGEAQEPFAPACACVSPTRRGDWQECFAKAHEALNAQLSKG